MRQRKLLLPMSEQSAELETNKGAESTSSGLSPKMKDSIHAVPTYVAVTIITLLCLLYGGVYFLDKSLPIPYKLSDEKQHPNEFIAEKAQMFLKGLTTIGPRVVGSKGNELEAVQYLNEEIDKIIKDAFPTFKITKDIQLTSGAYYLGFLPNGLINSYANVQNIIVKVDGKNTNESILINAHFDSVPTSPGACDDGIMVAVMLETLRKLTQSHHEYERNLIFLFNGAEESPLQGAHGFIKPDGGHSWAKTCKTIINLDSAGHGGRAILFQSGPKGSSALISHYLSVPFPFGQAAGEEIFQNNLIPSDTDFRIFREFGGMSGYDMAFVQNGYRYHTKYDNFKDLPLGSYQHAGSNVLALLRSLALDPIALREDDAKVIYFDVFNWFMISYSMLAAYILNIAVAMASVVVAILSASNLQLGINKSSVLYLLCTVVAILGSWITAGGLSLLIGMLLDALNSTMTWYRSPIIIFGLYVAPILGCSTGVLLVFNRFVPQHGKSLGTQSQIQMHVNRLIWTVVLFAGTLLKIRSVYVILFPVFFNTTASYIILIFKCHHSVRRWQIVVFICTIIPTVFSMYLAVELYSLFIPITGRIGANRNPELMIGLLTAFLILLVGSHYLCFSVLVRKQYVLTVFFFTTFVITFIVAVAGGVFPYSGNYISPTPQRFMIYHTNRIHHDVNDEILEQSGIFIMNLDRNSPNSVKWKVGLNNLYNISNDCEKYPACGMPISSARMVAEVEGSTWHPFQKAVINEATAMKKTTKILSAMVKQYSFTVEGPDHLTIFIRPKEGTKILRTSLGDIQAGELIFVNHVYGRIKTNLEFTMDVQANNINMPLMDFVVSGKYYNFNEKEHITDDFADFIKRFPDWADVVPALATYESYVI